MPTTTEHKFVTVNGIRVFYREAGPKNAPTLLLLHGFPSASHQFRRLMDTLGDRYHLVAPDFPGFGHTDTPDRDYTFDFLADVIEGFVQAINLERFSIYVFDYGSPVGFRLATRHPEWITGLVVQNGNAYEEGLSDVMKSVIANDDENVTRQALTPGFTRAQYEDGVCDITKVAPDGWALDQYFLDLPGRDVIQIGLMRNYRSNVALYPQWQEWLRTHKPPTLVVWGQNDMFFLPEGAQAYLRDVPDADVHLFDTGHFALEEYLPEISALIAKFLDSLAV
jgi:pimeloyl-ACP methyl ester carboxylesterase